MAIGPSLEDVRRDLKYMPTQTLTQYKQNPGKRAIDGVPLDLLAGMELSRRAEMQNELQAANAPNPAQMPTVTDAALQQLMGQPRPQPAPPPMPPRPPGPPQGMPPRPPGPPPGPPPAPQAAPPAPPPQPAPQMGLPGMLPPSPPQPGMPPVRRAGGGIIAFQNRGEVPRSSWDDLTGWFRAQQQKQIDHERRLKEAGKLVPGFFERVTPEEREARLREADRLRRNLPPDNRSFTERNRPDWITQPPDAAPAAAEPPAAAPAAAAAPTSAAPPPSLTDQLLKQFQAGRSGGSAPAAASGIAGMADIQKTIKDMQSPQIPGGRGALPEERALINESQAYGRYVGDLQSPYMSDSVLEQERAKEEGRRNDFYKEYNTAAKSALEERERRNAERESEIGSNAQLSLGLGLLGSRGRSFNERFGTVGKEVLGEYNKAQEAQQARTDAIKDAQLLQMKAEAAQKSGNYDLAQKYVNERQDLLSKRQDWETGKRKMGLEALKVPADVVGKVADRDNKLELAEARMQNALQLAQTQMLSQVQIAEIRAQAQHDIAAARQAGADANQILRLMQIANSIEVSQAKLAQGQIPTFADRMLGQRTLGPEYADPMTPTAQAVLRAHPQGAQLLADTKRGGLIGQQADDAIRKILKGAYEARLQKEFAASRTPGAPMSLDQAFANTAPTK